jgi:hypothetical protein
MRLRIITADRFPGSGQRVRHGRERRPRFFRLHPSAATGRIRLGGSRRISTQAHAVIGGLSSRPARLGFVGLVSAALSSSIRCSRCRLSKGDC